eukprot:TRINITY_DN90249_c0_g1_i1.p1 TRINITY_DN90249_c0_g1~~TRINITY_DN90249_c0_g1_i1.p1  ORF type:complete len:1084 (-),score=193.40 TRINITY_DN90249_c0_g1_i1:526-3777(-)
MHRECGPWTPRPCRSTGDRSSDRRSRGRGRGDRGEELAETLASKLAQQGSCPSSAGIRSAVADAGRSGGDVPQAAVKCIGRLGKQGLLETATAFLRVLQEDGLEPSVKHRTALLGAYPSKDWRGVLDDLNAMAAASHQHSVVPLTVAAQTFQKGSAWQLSLEAFHIIMSCTLEPDVKTYGAVMQACEKGKQHLQKRDLLLDMQRRGLPLNAFDQSDLVFSRLLELGPDASVDAIKSACESDAGAWHSEAKASTRLLAQLSDARLPRVAYGVLQALGSLQCPLDTIQWTAVMRAYQRSKQWQMVVKLLGEMALTRIPKNEFTYATALSACSSGGAWQAALQVFCEMQTQSAHGNCYTYSAAMSALALAAKWREAVALMLEMQSLGIELANKACTGVLQACREAGQWQGALGIFAELVQMQHAVDVIVFNAALSACSSGDATWMTSLHFLTSACDLELQPDLISYNTYLHALGKQGMWRLAVDVLGKMRASEIAPDVLSVNAALESCAKSEDGWPVTLDLLTQMKLWHIRADCMTISAAQSKFNWHLALEVVADAAQSKVKLDLHVYATAISVVAAAGEWRRALFLLNTTAEANFRPNHVCYNAAVDACQKGGAWAECLALLTEMRLLQMQPDLLAHNSVMRALPAWERACDFFADVTAKGIQPDIITFSAAVHTLGEGGLWSVATAFVSRMVQQALKCNDVAFSSAISSYEYCETVRLWMTSDSSQQLGQAFEGATAASDTTKSSRWRKALCMMSDALQRSLQVGDVVFNSALTTCQRTYAWDWTLNLFSHMQVARITPQSFEYGTAALSLMLAGRNSEATAFLDGFRQELCAGSSGCSGVTRIPERAQSGSPRIIGLQPGVVAMMKPAGLSHDAAMDWLTDVLGEAGHAADLTTVSRLDVGTSGVLCVARGTEMSAGAQWLRSQFAGRTVDKEYICVAVGAAFGAVGSRGTILCPLRTEDGQQSSQSFVDNSGGREAETRYKVLHIFDAVVGSGSEAQPKSCALLSIKLITGRTHQIRAHFSGIGRPLVSDITYGGAPSGTCPRVCLHCRRVSLLDLDGAPFVGLLPVPDDMKAVLMEGFQIG